MKYYLDCEFDGFKGPLLSMGIIREDGYSFYATKRTRAPVDPWVRENVLPIMDDVPTQLIGAHHWNVLRLADHLEKFFAGDESPHVISDWPDDIKYLCQELITGPGTMIAIPGITFEVVRVDAYPTTLRGAVQHNAWWDAQALKHLLTGKYNDGQMELPL